MSGSDHGRAAPRHRRCIVLRGDPAHTAAQAHHLLAGLEPSAVAWVGSPADAGRFTAVAPRATDRLLGRSFEAVVLDTHAGFDGDALGRCHGLVWGGGALIVRRPAAGDPEPRPGHLAVHPYGPEAVGDRFARHVERALATIAEPPPTEPLATIRPRPRGTPEQAEVVARLADVLAAAGPVRVTLLADRGRGKSSALGLALARLVARDPSCRIVVTAPEVEATAEVFRFAVGSPGPPTSGPVRFVVASELLSGPSMHDVIVIDEAAGLPVPWLRRITAVHPGARIVFATTTHGYEGSGRGFALRFARQLADAPVPHVALTLRAPIRWDDGDPLERAVFDALLLDTTAEDPTPPPSSGSIGPDDPRVTAVDRDALVAAPGRLREILGLLVHAHYRTTPGDLHRFLDAPNLEIHALTVRDRVVAASVVAHEGALPLAQCRAAHAGAQRLRAHALADALVAHLGRVEAGAMTMLRSVRIAVHPAWRRRGLATRLVQHVHASHDPDLFGTLFGAQAGLVQFRRGLGYVLARLSASHGTRTGEPAVLMLRPVSPRARALLTDLRDELARVLPRQLELLEADTALPLAAELVDALTADLPSPPPWTAEQVTARVHAYAFGPRTFESVAVAVARFVADRPAEVEGLDGVARGLVQGRVLHARPWRDLAGALGLTVPAAMRGLRRAVRTLWAAANLSAPPAAAEGPEPDRPPFDRNR